MNNIKKISKQVPKSNGFLKNTESFPLEKQFANPPKSIVERNSHAAVVF